MNEQNKKFSIPKFHFSNGYNHENFLIYEWKNEI